MWQDVLLAFDYEHASEFCFNYTGRSWCSPTKRPTVPATSKAEGKQNGRSHDARLASLFSKTEIMVLRFYHAVHGHGSKD